MISFDLVILTGLLGLVLYLVVPRLMTRIEGAPLPIHHLTQRREELKTELAEIGSSPSASVHRIVKEKIIPRFVSFGYLLRQYARRESLRFDRIGKGGIQRRHEIAQGR